MKAILEFIWDILAGFLCMTAAFIVVAVLIDISPEAATALVGSGVFAGYFVKS